MSIPFQVRKKVNFLKGEKEELWYAMPKKLQKKGGKTEKDLARLIAQRTGFHRGLVIGVLTELGEVIEDILSEGHSVTISGFGSFQTALTSKGFKSPLEVTPREVSVSRMYFVADRKLNKRLKEEKCFRIPFKYYLPKEMITKEMEVCDKKEEEITGEITGEMEE